MPAAAVIPTPRVYLNVAAVKKLVVEFLRRAESFDEAVCIRLENLHGLQPSCCGPSILL